MENNRPELEMNLFSHKGEPHYSFRGQFISCRDYGFQRSLGKERDTVMFEARSFKELFKQQDEEEKAKPKINIENIKQLMVFITNEFLTEKEKENVKREYKKEMSVQEKIKLFPEIYQTVLRMYLAHSERKGKTVQREFESLEHTIGSGMELRETARTQIYNPDAFIEGVE